jgi:hypothetical protein
MSSENAFWVNLHYSLLTTHKKTAITRVITVFQFGVILYQPSQGFIPYAGNGKQTEKFYTEFFISGWRYRTTIFFLETLANVIGYIRTTNYKAICF